MAENQDNQILDHTFNNGPSPKINILPVESLIQKTQIKMQLSSLNRDVNKIQAHLKSLKAVDQQRKKYANNSSKYDSKLFQGTSQSKNFNISQNHNQSKMSQYNYYGQTYRFQRNIDQLRVDPPQLSYKPKTECQISDSRHFECDIKSLNNYQFSRVADTGLEDPLHYKFPSQNYYIYFQGDQNKGNQKHKLSFNPSKTNKINNFDKRIPKQQNNQLNLNNTNQFKSNWILQKKITKMEKELKQLKKRQQQRQRVNKFKNTKKNDSKININSQVERMINSLWP